MTETDKLKPENTFGSVYTILESLLSGPFRKQFIDELMGTEKFSKATKILRTSLSSHTFKTSGSIFSLGNVVKILDDRTKADGFEVFHSWDHSDHTFSSDNTPVLMVDHFTGTGLKSQDERSCLSLLLDIYFFHVLALCSVRVWDDDRPQDNFDKLT